MAKTDRRVQRTRDPLKQALIELIKERGYDAITIQDIVDRANVGRTTFYAHYDSKDELFMNCHEAMLSQFQIVFLQPLTREELLSPDPPPEAASLFHHLETSRPQMHTIFTGRNSQQMLRRIRDWSALRIETNFLNEFNESESSIPFEVLANYLAGAQLTLVQWCLEKRRIQTLGILPQAFHRLQRAAIQAALGLNNIV